MDDLIDPEVVYRRWEHRHAQLLDQVPMLLQHLRMVAISLSAVDTTIPRVSGGGGDARAPFRIDPVDDVDDLWSALVEYTVEVAERLQVTPPDATGAAWTTSHGVRGVRAGFTPDDAHRAGWDITAWLVSHAARTWPLRLIDSEQHLYGLIRTLIHRYVLPPIEKPARRRTCTLCGERAVVVAWIINDTGEAECRTCGAVYAPDEGENDDR